MPQQQVADKKVKPRFRISGDKVIMVEAGNMEVATNGVIQETTPQLRQCKRANIAAKTSLANTRLIRTGMNLTQNGNRSPKTRQQKEEPVEIETKYSESLDVLKQRYAEKVLSEKAKSAKPAMSSASLKQNLTAGIAVLVLALGGYLGYKLKQKDESSAIAQQPAVERADVTGDLGATMQDEDNADYTSGDNTAQTDATTGTKILL